MARKILLRTLTFVIFLLPFLIFKKPTHAFFWLFQKKTGDKYVVTGTFGDALLEQMKKEAQEKHQQALQQEKADYPAGIVTIDKVTIDPVEVNKLTLEVNENGEISGSGEYGHLRFKTQHKVEEKYRSGGGGPAGDSYYWFTFSGRASGDDLQGETAVTHASYNYETGEQLSSPYSYPKGLSWTAKKKGDLITGTIKGVSALDLSFKATIGEIEEAEETEETPKATITTTPTETASSPPQPADKKKKLSRNQIITRMRAENYDYQAVLIGKKEMTAEEKADFVKDVFGIDPRDFNQDMGKGKKAYIIYSESIDSYRKTWLDSITKQSVAAKMLLESLGYQVEIVSPKNSNESFDYMVDPEATAIVNFAHQRYCSIEEVTPDDLPDQIKQATYRYYQKGSDKKTALEKTKQTDTGSLNKDLFINFSCHSLDDTNIVNYTVRPGGAYYGHKGILFPTEELDEKMRP